ncbi:MAG: hypothetical protein HY900_25975 [Deltaproteobacteria bacterium]|nr:hypothetical protein [Deltaproteobacteria bacterium]
MRFLCKKCGTQSPGDISDVEIREGALVFVCKACGASATLVESRAKSGGSSAANGSSAEKGTVEPDEDELVDLGEATLSRMLGKRVRIVAAIEDLSSALASPPDPARVEDAVEPTPAIPVPEKVQEEAGESALATSGRVPAVPPQPGPELEPGPSPSVVIERSPLPDFVLETESPARGRRSRASLAIAASVGLLAMATVALLEARPQRSPAANVAVSAAPSQPGSSPARATAEPASAATLPEAVLAARPSAAPGERARPVVASEDPAARIDPVEPRASTPAPAAPEPGGPGLSAEQIDAAFFRVRPAVRLCAVQEQRRHPDVKLGNETVTLTVAPTGEVTRVEFESHDLAGTPLEACLVLELMKFRVETSTGAPAVVRRVLELARPATTPN